MKKSILFCLLLVSAFLLSSCGGSGSVISVTIIPNEITLTVNSNQQFEGYALGLFDTGVDWSVQESGGGSITSGGYYTAPATVGTYHVIATAQSDSTVSAKAKVIVQASL